MYLFLQPGVGVVTRQSCICNPSKRIPQKLLDLSELIIRSSCIFTFTGTKMFGNCSTSFGQSGLALADLINTKSTSAIRILAAISSARGRRSPRLVSTTDPKSNSLSYARPVKEDFFLKKKGQKLFEEDYIAPIKVSWSQILFFHYLFHFFVGTELIRGYPQNQSC